MVPLTGINPACVKTKSSPHYGSAAAYPILEQYKALHSLLITSHNVLGNLENLLVSETNLTLKKTEQYYS